ncbi:MULTISPECIES: hypothetical protein [Rhodanobacter]|uniref:hypothetical protein n=1 Tax=Rhodanobacter TaxID=75309 RepID=UPI0004171CD5|nr:MULTISPECIES: hypothetical protein [Rhodanobacter]TAN16024.1 MAG: hypothetical protein EPN35_11840 [Rhodanobacter sp.]UJJ54688.1 hypothetical protein LRK53_17375 [Rhodanobacter thiooxydans]
MRATHWLIGCALCVAGLGGATASSLDATQDLDSSSHATLDNASSHDASCSGGDVLGLNRDCPPAGNNDSTGSSSGNGNTRSGGGSSTPTPARRPHLGWQSLLPGSIQ